MTKPVQSQAGAGSTFHRPFCPDGRAALDLGFEAGCPEQNRPFLLVATIIASAMAFIDATVVTIALPPLQADLDATFQAVQWVVNAYALFLGGLIVVGGGAGDRVGRRRTFVTGTAIFAVASLACALATSVEWLIVARSVQGIGAALLVPQSLAIIAAAYPKTVRGRAIGIWAGASAITTSLGPVLGGFLIDALHWRAIFLINLPLSAAVIVLALRYVPESRNDMVSGPLDWFGGLLVIVAFGSLAAGLTLITETSGANVLAVTAICFGAIASLLFVFREARAASPIMPLSLFGNRIFLSANIITLFLYGALTGILFLLPFDLIESRGMSATMVGLTLLPIGIIIGTLSRFAGVRADRDGPRGLLVVGSLLVAASAAGLAVGAADYWIGVVAPIAILSLGMALVVAPLTTAVMVSAPDNLSGAASGVNNAASRLAGLFAITIIGAVASVVYLGELKANGIPLDDWRFGVLPGAGRTDHEVFEQAFLAAYQVALSTAAIWGVLAAITAFAFMRPSTANSP
jgi:EmrB/QacA subfamily drug resistance transporter